MRSKTHSLLCIFAGALCLFACSDDDGDGGGAVDTGVSTADAGGRPVGVASCGFDIWPAPESPRESYDCFDDQAGGFSCRCVGDQLTAQAASCLEAVQTACSVAEPERQFCEDDDGTCWPGATADDPFRCRCEGSQDVAMVDAASCGEALFQHCSEPCGNLFGQCSPAPGNSKFGCFCDHYPGNRIVSAPACEEAVRSCEPGTSLATSCQNYAGYCDQQALSFACTCNNGMQRELTFDELGEDACDPALVMACPDIDAPAGFSCESESAGDGGQLRATCVRDDTGEMAGHRCTCERGGETGEEDRGEFIPGTDCQAALTTICEP